MLYTLSVLFQLWYCYKKTMLYTLVCTFSIVVLLKENHALYTCLVYTFSIVVLLKENHALYTCLYFFNCGIVLLKENHALYTCLYFFNCGIVKRKPCFIHLSVLFQLWYCEKKTMLYTLVYTFSIVVLWYC